jgi:hypothetical protein
MGFFPLNQLVHFVFKSICFIFLAMCSFQFNLQSKCSPSYFNTSVSGMVCLVDVDCTSLAIPEGKIYVR